jgi:hypothetical protein
MSDCRLGRNLTSTLLFFSSCPEHRLHKHETSFESEAMEGHLSLSPRNSQHFYDVVRSNKGAHRRFDPVVARAFSFQQSFTGKHRTLYRVGQIVEVLAPGSG